MFTSRGLHGRLAIAYILICICTWLYAKCRYPLRIKSLLTYNGLPENLRYYAFNFVSSPACQFSRISRYLKVQKHDMFTKLDYTLGNLKKKKKKKKKKKPQLNVGLLSIPTIILQACLLYPVFVYLLKMFM